MASIYKGASIALVLDVELMATYPGYGCEGLDLESRARLACSVWMSRSWTLQEGYLPPKIAIHFLNSVILLGRTSKEDGVFREQIVREGIPLTLHFEPASEADTLTARDAGELRSVDQLNPGDSGADFAFGCQCANIALQRTFYSLFFEKCTGFVSAWNVLAGRSTTMTKDIPLIITNMLDLDNKDLFKFGEAYEMLQTILLSVEDLPFSIFFNTGPRYDPGGDRQNRWIPASISSDVLTPPYLEAAQGTYLTYKHKVESELLSAYIVNDILGSKRTVYLLAEDVGLIYRIEPLSPDHGDISSDSFTSTCVIIEKEESPRSSGIRRGACFYIKRDHPDTQNNRPWWHRIMKTSPPTLLPIGPPRVNMTFNRPLRLTVVGSDIDLEPDIGCKCSLNPITTAIDFSINYDPIPGFKPLKRREHLTLFQTLRTWLLPVFILGTAGGLLAVAWTSPAITSLPQTVIICFSIPIVGVAILTWIFIKDLFRDGAYILDTWRYIRSFEAIAAQRPPQGVV